jgi:hypothetical protein
LVPHWLAQGWGVCSACVALETNLKILANDIMFHIGLAIWRRGLNQRWGSWRTQEHAPALSPALKSFTPESQIFLTVRFGSEKISVSWLVVNHSFGEVLTWSVVNF